MILRCKKGDKNSFGPLIQLYRRQLFSYLWRFTHSDERSKDLFQEVLIKVWKGLKNYKENDRFASWLFSIAHNVAIDEVRKEKRMSDIFEYGQEREPGIYSNPYNILVAAESEKMILDVIDTLPEKQKEVFLLRQHGELTFKEIADLINEPLSTVLSHMHYATKKIKKALRKENAI